MSPHQREEPPTDKAAEETEALIDAVFELLNNTRDTNDIAEWIVKVHSDAYHKGYQDGITDESMANEAKRRRSPR